MKESTSTAFVFVAGFICAAAAISTIAICTYLYNVEEVKYQYEHDVRMLEIEAEKQKDLLERGFVIQNGMVWPIPIGHEQSSEVRPEMDF